MKIFLYLQPKFTFNLLNYTFKRVILKLQVNFNTFTRVILNLQVTSNTSFYIVYGVIRLSVNLKSP
jgi:hypothetical protein